MISFVLDAHRCLIHFNLVLDENFMLHSAVAFVVGCDDPDCESHGHCNESDTKLILHVRYTDRKHGIDLYIELQSPSNLTLGEFTKDVLDLLFLDDISFEHIRLVGFYCHDDYHPIKTRNKDHSLEQLGISNDCQVEFEPTLDAHPPKLCRLIVVGPDEVKKFSFPWYRARTTLDMLMEFIIESFSLRSVEPGQIHLLSVFRELNFFSYSQRRLSQFDLHDGMSVYVQIIPPLSPSSLTDKNKIIHVQCIADQTSFHFDLEHTRTIANLGAKIQRCFVDRQITDLKLFNETNDSLDLDDSSRTLRSFGVRPGQTISATFRLVTRRVVEKKQTEEPIKSTSATIKKPKPPNVIVICQYPSNSPEAFNIAVTKTINDVLDEVKRRFHQKRLEISKMDSKGISIDFKNEEHRCLADLGLKSEDTINVTIVDKSPVHRSIVSQKPPESPTQDKSPKPRRKKNMPLGLDNLGNSCYMNSALQCLLHIPPLTNFFLEGFRNAHADDSEDAYDDINPFDTIGDVTGAYADLLCYLMRCSTSNDDEYSLKPTRMKEQLGRKDARFATDDQQDVQEFMTFFLDAIHEEFKAKNQNRAGTTINKLFFGRLTSTITCTACNNEESTTHPVSFLSIPLDRQERRFFIHFIPIQGKDEIIPASLPISARIENVVDMFSRRYNQPSLYYHILPILSEGEIDMKTPLGEIPTDELIFMEQEDRLREDRPEPLKAPEKKSTLQDCLAQFFSQEELQDGWRCSQENCKKTTLATKQFKLSTLPIVLIIQFKRFSHANGLHHKVETFVEYPLDGLDLNQFLPSLEESAIYDLVAVSAHLGSICGGHYIAYAKHTTGDKSEWYKFDDSYVSRVKPNDYQFEIVSRNAYLLFYVRRHTGTLV